MRSWQTLAYHPHSPSPPTHKLPLRARRSKRSHCRHIIRKRKNLNHTFNGCAVPVHFTAFIYNWLILNISKECVKSCVKTQYVYCDYFNCYAITWHSSSIVLTTGPLREAAISVCGQSSAHPVTLWLDSFLNECLWRLTPTAAHPHTIWMHKEANSAEGFLWAPWCYSFLGTDLYRPLVQTKSFTPV